MINTEGGIWGGMAQDVTVSSNHVENCADVCLDAEGSKRVTFSNNVAKNAGGAVLASFFFSREVTFENNTVSSGDAPGLNGPLFRLANQTADPDSILVTVRDNTFTWNGTGSGMIVKEASREFVFERNTVNNAVLELDPGNNAGGMRVLRNRILLDRSTSGRPAIRAGHSYACWTTSTICAVEIRGNHIRTSVAQDTAKGIVYYADGNTAVDSTVRITSDTIRGFSRWLKIHAATAQPTYTVTDNRFSGVTNNAIEVVGTPSITQSGNQALAAMQASITGPISVSAMSTWLWLADAANGTEPYTYQWYVNNVPRAGATDAELMYTAGTTSFTLKVVVTGADGFTAQATRNVTVH